MILFLKVKKRIFALMIIFVLSIGHCPVVYSNNTTLYMNELFEEAIKPQNVVQMLTMMFTTILAIYIIKFGLFNTIIDYSVEFKPINKNEITVNRTQLIGPFPEKIDETISKVNNNNYIEVRINKEQPIVGIVLDGKSGTGKTFLTLLIAKEASCPVFMVSLQKLQKQIVGASSKSVQNLFETAKKQALDHPSKTAIICIDELHNFHQQLSVSYAGSSGEITDALVTEIDGQYTKEKYKDVTIIVIGTTNNYQLLDEAIKTRFSQHIQIPAPTLNDIKNYVQNLLRGILNIDDTIISRVAYLMHQEQEAKNYRELDVMCKNLISEVNQNKENISLLGKMSLFFLKKWSTNDTRLDNLYQQSINKFGNEMIYTSLQLTDFTGDITQKEIEILQNQKLMKYEDYTPLKVLKQCRIITRKAAIQNCNKIYLYNDIENIKEEILQKNNNNILPIIYPIDIIKTFEAQLEYKK